MRLHACLLTFITLATTSCSSMIARMGTDVAKYEKEPQNFSREQVISHLGQPSISATISPRRRGSDLESTSYSHLTPFTPAGDGSWVARVDRHDLKAPIRTWTDEFAAGASKVYAGYTLGLSELYLAPSFLAIKLNEHDRSFYAFYDRHDRLINSALSPIENRKAQQGVAGNRR
jgi:hypothetical protein